MVRIPERECFSRLWTYPVYFRFRAPLVFAAVFESCFFPAFLTEASFRCAGFAGLCVVAGFFRTLLPIFEGNFCLAALAASLAVFAVEAEIRDLPFAARLPMTVPAMAPATAPSGPPTTPPTIAPATPPAVCFETGRLLLTALEECFVFMTECFWNGVLLRFRPALRSLRDADAYVNRDNIVRRSTSDRCGSTDCCDTGHASKSGRLRAGRRSSSGRRTNSTGRRTPLEV